MRDAIGNFMNAPVHTLGVQETLAEAHELMNRFAIRHLPVLEGGKLVGMLSQRDLHLIETLKDVDPEVVTVEEAMNQDILTVGPNDPLEQVARRMAEHKYGSAVVIRDDRHVLGIFTSTDALRVLGGLVGGDERSERIPAGAHDAGQHPAG
jgi:acetoin utilization protein AcuB